MTRTWTAAYAGMSKENSSSIFHLFAVSMESQFDVTHNKPGKHFISQKRTGGMKTWSISDDHKAVHITYTRNTALHILGLCTHTQTVLRPSWTGTTWVSWHQKGKNQEGKTNPNLLEQEWQWHKLGHMQICTLIQTQLHQHPNTQFYRPYALLATQPTVSKHWRLWNE